MENNSSPYIYEKPLRNKRSIRNRSLAAVGLVAIGGAIGGGAFASSLINGATAEATATPSEPVIINTDASSSTEQVALNPESNAFAGSVTSIESAQAQVRGQDRDDSIISIPLEQAQPKKSTAALELPSLSGTNFGNTSSATPYASGGQTGSNLSSYQTRDRDDDRYEDHSKTEDQDDRDDDHEDDNEDENEENEENED